MAHDADQPGASTNIRTIAFIRSLRNLLIEDGEDPMGSVPPEDLVWV